MAKFTPRTTAPSATDKHWIHASKGGYSEACVINKKTGSTIPNCVGYVVGRLMEILNINKDYWGLPLGEACQTIEEVSRRKLGLKTGKTPKLGAVIVWTGGKDGSGHVMIVEEVKSNGDILVSGSNYKGTRFYTQTLTKSSNYKFGSTYTFAGFVYCGKEFDNKSTREPNPTLIENRYKVIKDGKQIEADTYLENAVSTAKSKNAVVIDSTTGKQVYPETKATTSAKKEDYNLNNIPNRFKVKKNGVQLAAYTTWSYAVNYAKRVGAVIVDGTNGKTIFR